MVIAVYINSSPTDFFEKDFIPDIFLRLAKQYPQHQFIFIADKNFAEKFIPSKNIIVVLAGAEIKKPLLLQYQLNYKIPAILRKHKADVFISTGGYCSLRTKVPQCIIINDLSFLKQASFYSNSWLRFYKSNTVKFLNKATTIIATSQCLKNEIVQQYKIAGEKIGVAYYSNENFKPLSEQQKETVKQTYTGGLEYFLYSGPIHPLQGLTVLLKAFSFFKKRQKSNMQLIIASKNAAADNAFIKSLASFKYRNEVKVLDNLPDETLAAITGAAYALVYPSIYKGITAPLTQAMQSDVPSITANAAVAKEIGGGAAVYLNNGDFNDIADKMMLLFKNEDKRNELVTEGRQQAVLHNWNKTDDTIWEAILKCTM